MNLKQNGQCPLTLLHAISEANPAELSLLLEAFARIQEAHHGVSGPDHRMYKGMENTKKWAKWQTYLAKAHMEHDSGFDASAVHQVKGMNHIMTQVSAATLYHALIECTALQRRLITGKPYGPFKKTTPEYDTSDLLEKAKKGVGGVRYSSYMPMNPTVVYTLCVYVKRNYRLVIADLNDTLMEVLQWKIKVIPEIEAHLKQ